MESDLQELIEEASALEGEEEYLDACHYWSRVAFERLLEWDFQPWASGAGVFGDLLHAISCAVRADADVRAQFLQSLVEASQEQTEAAVPSDKRALLAASCEWVGDGYLLLGSERAITWYESAYGGFERSSDDAARRWAMETAYDNATMALTRYLDHQGYESSSDGDLSAIDYETRLNTKLRIAAERLAERYGDRE